VVAWGIHDKSLSTTIIRPDRRARAARISDLQYPLRQLIPVGDLRKRINELNSADEIVAHCKSGMRSAKAVDFLTQAGFRKVRNMKGGILASER
jgi:rhodanese-related sulfurtransferase